jgi:NADP-dependent 3-hydroxy acid dehydrogenase YdfG
MNKASVGKIVVVTGAARGIGRAISGPGLGQHLFEQSYLKSLR